MKYASIEVVPISGWVGDVRYSAVLLFDPPESYSIRDVTVRGIEAVGQAAIFGTRAEAAAAVEAQARALMEAG